MIVSHYACMFPFPEPPGKVIDLKVTDSTYSTLSLGWTKPTEEEGVQDEAKGYFVELRPAENPEWGRCNTSAIIMNSYTIMGLKSMAMYWVRVVATNEGGDGEPQELDNYIIAMPPPGKLSNILRFSIALYLIFLSFFSLSVATKTLPILLQWNPTSLTEKLKTLWWYKPETLPASTLTFRYNIHRKKKSFLFIATIEVAIWSHN